MIYGYCLIELWVIFFFNIRFIDILDNWNNKVYYLVY